MSVLSRNEQRDIIVLSVRQKLTQTLTKKIHFLIKWARWLVTHIYKHFTFEQSKFKKDFVVMTQKARQRATSLVERDFCKF